MDSYFSKPQHIDFFSMGFDLIRDQLPKEMIEDIIEKIEENLEKYPDDRSSVLALDALYDAIDEWDCAIETDSRYNSLTNSSIFTLREARHQMLNGSPEESEKLLDTVIRQDSEDSLIGQLGALIAYGRRNEKKQFTTMWNRLRRQYGIDEHISKKDPNKLDTKYTILDDILFKENMEGIGFLFTFDIRQGREAEIVDLITSFRDYLSTLTHAMLTEAIAEGFTDSILGFRVIAAISSGMVKAAEEILNMEDSITSAVVAETINPALDEIREIRRKMLVLVTLKHWSLNPVKPTPDLIRTLQEQSEGNSELIFTMIDLLDRDRPRMRYEKIRLKIQTSGRKEHSPQKKEPDRMTGVYGFNETPAFAGQHAPLTTDSEDPENLNVNTLLESGREDEAFEYLLGIMKTGHLLKRYTSLFELACTLNRMDDLLVLRPVLESEKISSAMYLLDAYGRLMNKDVKGGLALIDRAEGSGLDADDALLISARFLLISNFPKRVVGICEKMFRRGIPGAKIYPLLIRALRDLGREDDARAAEETFHSMCPQEPGGKSSSG